MKNITSALRKLFSWRTDNTVALLMVCSLLGFIGSIALWPYLFSLAIIGFCAIRDDFSKTIFAEPFFMIDWFKSCLVGLFMTALALTLMHLSYRQDFGEGLLKYGFQGYFWFAGGFYVGFARYVAIAIRRRQQLRIPKPSGAVQEMSLVA
jgi:hypothetical protein